MAITYQIPELMRMLGLMGYTPQLATAINRLLQAKDKTEYRLAKREAVKQITGYDDIQVVESPEGIKGSMFGLPLLMPLYLEAPEPDMDDLLLEDAVLEISQTRNIVKTIVQGRDNTVKEFVNNGDYAISVRGSIFRRDYGHPTEDLKRLRDYLTYKGSIKVVHEVLNALDVHEIVITGFQLPATPFVNVQPYAFTAVSEEPVELIL